MRVENADDSGSDKSGSDKEPKVGSSGRMSKKEKSLNSKLEKCEEDMKAFAESGEGNPSKIVKMLNSVTKRMDKYGFEYAAMDTMEGYADLMRAAEDQCSGKSCSDSDRYD